MKKISQLKLYDYKMKKGIATGDEHQHGILAQELREVFPHAVVDTSYTVDLENGEKVDGLVMVNKDALLMETVGATVEIAKRIEGLQLLPQPASVNGDSLDVSTSQTYKRPRPSRKRRVAIISALVALIILLVIAAALVLFTLFLSGTTIASSDGQASHHPNSHANSHAWFV